MALLNNCRFIATAGGFTNWTYSSAVGGCQSPAAAGAVDGTKYTFIAISQDLMQFEIAQGNYTASGSVFARTTVLYNSAGTGTGAGQSGAGALINFASAPQVAIIAAKEDIALTPASWTRTVINITGAGTYNRKPGCTAINVRMVGGGGGGGSSGTAALHDGAGGGNTVFGSLQCNGGNGGSGGGGSTGGVGGAASGGDLNYTGGIGGGVNGGSNVGGAGGGNAGGQGGVSFFGGAGMSPAGSNPGIAAVASSGSGGSGASAYAPGSIAGACGGGAGGYLEKLIVNPAASYSYTVGTGGAGGAAGTGGFAGGSGGSGIIIIDEYY